MSRSVTSRFFCRSNLDFLNSRVHHQNWYIIPPSNYYFLIGAGQCCYFSIRYNRKLCFSRCWRIEYSGCVCHCIISWCENQGSRFINGVVFRRKRRCFRSSGTSGFCRSYREVCFCNCSVRGTLQPFILCIISLSDVHQWQGLWGSASSVSDSENFSDPTNSDFVHVEASFRI